MTNLTITQQLKSNVRQIELIKTQNHLLLSQFVATDIFLDLLNETKLDAEPIETYVIENTIQIKYSYKNLGFKIVLTDKELVDTNIKIIFKEKVSTRIEEIDYNLKDIEITAKLIAKKFDNAKK